MSIIGWTSIVATTLNAGIFTTPNLVASLNGLFCLADDRHLPFGKINWFHPIRYETKQFEHLIILC